MISKIVSVEEKVKTIPESQMIEMQHTLKILFHLNDHLKEAIEYFKRSIESNNIKDCLSDLDNIELYAEHLLRKIKGRNSYIKSF